MSLQNIASLIRKAPVLRSGMFCLVGMLGVTACSVIACSEEIEAFPERYVGIGVELTMETSGARVVRVLDGGPAATAHFAKGDLILQANGELLRGKSLAQVVQLLRGEQDSKLRLLVHTYLGDEVDRSVVRLAIAR